MSDIKEKSAVAAATAATETGNIHIQIITDEEEKIKHPMKVLIACEESQRVCAAFRELGHEAYSCDIQEPSGGHPEWHILGDVLRVLNPAPLPLSDGSGICFVTMDGRFHKVDRWDLIIAHPPCTYLTPAGSCRLFDKDHNVINKDREQKLWDAVSFFRMFLDSDCDKIAVENPAPMKYCKLPKYSQIIEPYYFGDSWKKRTCLWLKNLPPLKPTEMVKPISCWVETNGRTCRTKLRGAKGARSAKERSKTFPGIAKAMAQQWGGNLNE